MQNVIDRKSSGNNQFLYIKIPDVFHYLKPLFFLIYWKLNLSPYELSINRQRKYFKLEYNFKNIVKFDT